MRPQTKSSDQASPISYREPVGWWRLIGSGGSPLPGSSSASARSTSRRGTAPSIIFLWQSFAPHHVDRCEACVAHFGSRYDIYGVEVATFDAEYQWRGSIGSQSFTKLTLFPGIVSQKIGTLPCFLRIVAASLRLRSRYVFLCNYDKPAIFFSAIVLRLLGRRIVVMQDSKFDDKQRYLFKEFLKSLLYRPYHAALVAGMRAKSYLAFLGIPERRIFIGYDTVSVDRVRASAGSEPAPGGIPHRERHFTIVARFVPKKNLSLALDAYAAYVAQNPQAPRDLHLCGSGGLEPVLREQAERLQLKGVHFHGYLPEEEVARLLGSTLALILPSVEEQHGLVINEALAMGVPVLVSDNCGARDVLVRSAVNGYIFETDNAPGLAHLMTLLDRDAGEWTRLAQGTHQFEAFADTKLFVAAVEQALDSLSAPGGAR